MSVSHSHDIAVVDFDRDGRLDVATLLCGHVELHHNTGTSLETKVTHDPGTSCVGEIHATDLNGDGKQDIGVTVGALQNDRVAGQAWSYLNIDAANGTGLTGRGTHDVNGNPWSTNPSFEDQP